MRYIGAKRGGEAGPLGGLAKSNNCCPTLGMAKAPLAAEKGGQRGGGGVVTLLKFG